MNEIGRKVAHISSSPFELMKGGVPTYVETLVRWQRQNGIDAVEFARNSRSEVIIERDGLRLIGTNPSLGLLQGVPFRSLVRQLMKRDDIICVHYLPHIFWSPELLLSGRFVMYFHGPAALEAKSERASTLYCGMLRLLESFVYRRCRKIVCLSEAFKLILVDYYGVEPNRIVVIPGHLRDEVRSVPQRKRYAASGLRLVTVRRLRERMGLEVLIDAFAIIQKTERMQGSRLLIIGDGPLRDSLLARIARLGLSESIALLGSVPNDVRDSVIAESDYFVLPTRELEGFGMVVLESLAQGVPVVASNVGGIPEILQSLGYGELLVPPGSADRLAAKLLELYSRGTQCEIPVELINKKYSLKALGPIHLDIYRTL
jgi:glycosyltransferase involved in cell wall biosynthesis